MIVIKEKVNLKKVFGIGLFISIMSVVVFILIIHNNFYTYIAISNQDEKVSLIENQQDPIVYIKENKETGSDNKENISLQLAENIAKEKIKDGQVLYSEYRNSSELSYYLVRVAKDGSNINVYVDTRTGEILYESKE